MTQSVRDVMTKDPITLPKDATIREAALHMRKADIGPVIVMSDGDMCGIVTDRDIVVRAIAEGRDPNSTRLGEICTQEVETLSPDSPVREAVEMMRSKAIRRLPVAEDGRPVGIVSLGDLAVERDPDSVLGQISQAPPDR